MNKNLKLPWSVDDTIENLKEVKEILKTYVLKSNYEGKGERATLRRLKLILIEQLKR